jgi:ORMDL family
MFHWVTGMPFDSELHGGAYDDLTLWEQIDDGAQYTPAKKWLLSVPIMLCVFHSLLRHNFVLIDTKIPRIDTLHKLQPMAICCQLNSTDPISDNSEATTGAKHILSLYSRFQQRLLQLHRQRVRFMAEGSGLPTPTTPISPSFSTSNSTVTSRPGSRPVSTIKPKSDLSQITDAHFQ